LFVTDGPKIAGQFIAVGWDDGYVRIMGLESNKAAHSIRVVDCDTDAAPRSVRISHIGWTRNRVAGRRREQQVKDWEKALGREARFDDLPRELMFLEVDETLPKISPLPSGSVGIGCVSPWAFFVFFFSADE
jgi:anaphase-promoting complex subunit 4